MNKHINKTIIYMLVALIVVSASLIVMNTMRDSVAVEKAKEAYTLYMQQNPASKDSDFIYIYEEHIVIAIRGGKVLSKEYVSEAHAVKAATGNSKVLHYSLSSTGDDRLFIVKVFDKQSDIFALGSQKLAAGADSLIIKVVSNGMIFANFEIPASAIADKNSPVEVTISKIDPKENVKLGDNQEGFAYDIDVTNLVENNTSLIKVSMSGPKGLVSGTKSEAISVYHKSSAIASTYDAKTGEVAFETTDFSPYTFVYNMITVNTVEELRYYLGREGSGNIRLGKDIEIDMATYRDTTGQDAEGKVVSYKDDKGYKVYYARGFYDGQWMYFGSLIIGDKAIDLNGHKITYTGSKSNNDAGLFVVNTNSSLTIIDKEGTGKIVVPYDQYAVWSVNPTSTANIYDGIFMTDEYAVAGQTSSDAALLYSSGGKINVYGGYYMYNPQYRSGGFNVVNNINEPRIWIYEGVKLSNNAFRDPYDEDSIVLVGGAELSKEATAVRELMSESELVIKNWYEVKGQKIEVISTLNNDKYLYRVGNKNAFPLGVFFNQILDDIDISNVSVRFVDIAATNEHNAKNPYNKNDKDSGYYGYIADIETTVVDQKAQSTLKEYTVKFLNSFTGPVRLELHNGNGVIYASINLEVVEGYNVYSGGTMYKPTSTNVCLLSNITLSTNNAIEISGGYAFYGNGFTITDGRNNPYGNANGLINIKDGTMDNVQIDGYDSTNANGSVNDPGGAPVVLISGKGNIYNSYIQGGRQAVRCAATGNVHLKNVTLDGGARCNMEIASGEVILENCVTTTDTTGGAKGLGVLISSTGAKLTLEGTFTQYNWLAQAEIPDAKIKTIFGDVYEGKSGSDYDFSPYPYDVGNTPYLNMGIFFFNESVQIDEAQARSQITDNTNGNYGYISKDATVGVTTYMATCYLPKKEVAQTTFTAPTYEVLGNHPVAPKPVFNHTHKDNYVAKTSDSNVYCFYNDLGYVDISFETGGNKVWNTDILTVTKLGRTLKPSVSMNGTDYTGKTITFTEAGTYELTYIYDDPYNCTANHASYSQTYTQKLTIKVTVIEPENVIDPPTFTYVGTVAGYEAVKVVVNNKTYIMPNVTGDVSGKIGHTTVGGVDIYYPIVTVAHGSFTNATSYSSGAGYFYSPAFSAINITDINPLTGNSVTYNTNMQTWPHNIGKTEDVRNSNEYYGYTGTTFTTMPYTINLSYSDYSRAYKSGLGLCFAATNVTNSPKSAADNLVEFYYKGNDENTYYYFINYEMAEWTKKDSCVTPDTLVTLADGTQKEIQHVTYEDMLLVWNFYTGKYDVMPASIVMNHGYGEYTVTTLNFADGTTVNTINGHGFFDAETRKYVILSDHNAEDYIGHDFVKVDGNGYTTTKLISYSVKIEYMESWSILTAEQYNCILEGMWTLTPAEVEGSPDYLMPFEVGADMKYIDAKLQADIQQYGLYTYADFAEYMTEEQFTALGLSAWKVAVGKGYITWDDILYLIEIHLG